MYLCKTPLPVTSPSLHCSSLPWILKSVTSSGANLKTKNNSSTNNMFEGTLDVSGREKKKICNSGAVYYVRIRYVNSGFYWSSSVFLICGCFVVVVSSFLISIFLFFFFLKWNCFIDQLMFWNSWYCKKIQIC